MSETSRPVPGASRPHMPGYGFETATSSPGERLPWSQVSDLLEASRNYWICTTRPDGRPHAAPVWGLWLDGAFYFSTGQQSRKARNLAANPEVVIHIEGEAAVILEGAAEVTTEASLLSRLRKAYKAKYNWDMEGYPFYAVRPRVGFSFTEDLAETATRWHFQGD